MVFGARPESTKRHRGKLLHSRHTPWEEPKFPSKIKTDHLGQYTTPFFVCWFPGMRNPKWLNGTFNETMAMSLSGSIPSLGTKMSRPTELKVIGMGSRTFLENVSFPQVIHPSPGRLMTKGTSVMEGAHFLLIKINTYSEYRFPFPVYHVSDETATMTARLDASLRMDSAVCLPPRLDGAVTEHPNTEILS